jgi:membrane associated rhomboid family serine protease
LILPIQHENMSSRRWPIITLALILFNLAIFAGTHRTVDKQDSHLWTVREHILILAAKFPNLVLTTDAREWVSGYQRRFPDEWAEMQNPDSDPVDEWDARTKQIDDPAALQAEMDSLEVQYSQLSDSSITEQFAFAYAHPKPITYLTSTFLHMDWWHVLGNMWFLWLAGFLLEDAWGRPLYLLIYLTAGALASQFNLWMAPGAFGYSLGASGAIAGLMGAFLVRFPNTKIRMMWFFDLGLFPFCRFWMRAYWLLPFWVLLEINSGMGPRDGVAHWAHVGGFLFGALAAIGLRYSGLERKIDQAIEQKVSWTAEAEIVRANDMMESGKLEEAAVILNEFLATNPDCFVAWNLLRAVYWRASNIPAYREATGKLCELHLQASDAEAAWQDYEDFLNAGGQQMPAKPWLDLCRLAERRNEFERAVTEYEKLAATYPSEREAVLAKISVARICLKYLHRPQEALWLYEAASASAVPHLDLERDIELGSQKATNVLRHQADYSNAEGIQSKTVFAP